MTLYDEMQQLTREILADPDFKQGSIVLVKLTPGSGPVDDPGPAVPSYTPLDGAARGVAFKYVMSGQAVASDIQVTHSVVPGVVPAIADFVDIDGLRHKITQVIPRPRAGVPVSYTLIVNR